jgi:hypothetical protein
MFIYYFKYIQAVQSNINYEANVRYIFEFFRSVELNVLKVILLVITISSLRVFKNRGRMVSGLTTRKSNLGSLFSPEILALQYK